MKCPYEDCKHSYQEIALDAFPYYDDLDEDFYVLSVKLEKPEDTWDRTDGYQSNKASLWACPKCRRVFIE